jgi:hypothetical protein
VPAGVTIQNLDDVLARLDRLPAVARREVDEVLADVAETNAALIRSQAGRAGRQASAASRSVSASGKTISGGGPFFMGSVFGGQGRPTTQQFQPYVGGNGYWFFTSLSDGYPAALQRFADVVDTIAREWDGA